MNFYGFISTSCGNQFTVWTPCHTHNSSGVDLLSNNKIEILIKYCHFPVFANSGQVLALRIPLNAIDSINMKLNNFLDFPAFSAPDYDIARYFILALASRCQQFLVTIFS